MTRFSHFVSLISYEMQCFAHKAEVSRICCAEIEASVPVAKTHSYAGIKCVGCQGYVTTLMTKVDRPRGQSPPSVSQRIEQRFVQQRVTQATIRVGQQFLARPRPGLFFFRTGGFKPDGVYWV